MNEFGKSDIKTTDIAPFSVRVTEDVKARLKQLQEESGATQPDFYRSLVGVYIENQGIRDGKTQEEEDIMGALAVISNRTIALVNRLSDKERAQRKATERYNADLEEMHKEIESLNEVAALQTADSTIVIAENESLKKQVENLAIAMQEQSNKLNHKAAKEIEDVKHKLQKKIDNLQMVADTITEMREQVNYFKETASKAEYELHQSIEVISQEKNKINILDNSNKELKIRFEATSIDNSRLQAEVDILKEKLAALSLQLSEETIAKNRAEAKLEILEPRFALLKQESLANPPFQIDEK